MFSGTFSNDEEHKTALEKWAAANEDTIQRSLEAQRTFSAEKYALATLCGAVLQVASTAIRTYSTNTEVPEAFSDIVSTPSVAARHCIGRDIRGVPIGLIIYAGRNQYNHVDDGQLRAPNETIFEKLATGHTYGIGIRDPAFDLQNGLVWNYVSNITSIMGWRGYEKYEKDMRTLLGI